MMLSSGRPVVVSLNYHEVTRDPRVMKQARALADAGYDMHVFCDHPEGTARNEGIEGVTVHRFRVFDPRNIRSGWEDRCGFMPRSFATIRDKIGPVTRALQAEQTLSGQDLPDHLLRAHYTQHSGAERRKRKWQRIRALSARWLRSRFTTEGRKAFSELMALEGRRRRLFQAEGILFAEGLIAQPLPDRVDVVHAHDIYTLPAGVLLAQRTGARLIYDAHEYEPARASKIDPAALDLPMAIEDDCLPLVDAMITVSDSIADLYAARFAGPRPIVLHNVPEMADFGVELDPAKDLCARLPLAPQTRTVVFTGLVLGRQRGLDKAVEALKYLPDCVLVVLGPRVEAADRWLMATAEKHAVAARVLMLPPVAAQDVPSAISGFSVAICPIQDVSTSYRYAMPNKLFEAAFAGIPICVSDLPEMRRFVETLENGVVMDQTDPAAIAAAIREVIANRDRYLLTDRAREELHKNYGWPAQIAKLLALYGKLGYPAPRLAGQFVAVAD